jgi:hypothetical protein
MTNLLVRGIVPPIDAGRYRTGAELARKDFSGCV